LPTLGGSKTAVCAIPVLPAVAMIPSRMNFTSGSEQDSFQSDFAFFAENHLLDPQKSRLFLPMQHGICCFNPTSPIREDGGSENDIGRRTMLVSSLVALITKADIPNDPVTTASIHCSLDPFIARKLEKSARL
jgi:hypothetical protein